MNKLALSGLLALASIASAYAQPAPVAEAPAPASSPAAPSASEHKGAAEMVSKAASRTKEELAEIKEIFQENLEDINKNTSPGTREIMAVGIGAGLGFLASGYIMTGTIAPLVSSLSSTLGLSDAATGIVTASVTTVGIVSGTYAGGVYARDLVTPE